MKVLCFKMPNIFILPPVPTSQKKPTMINLQQKLSQKDKTTTTQKQECICFPATVLNNHTHAFDIDGGFLSII
jgi:hypothetical protein